MNELHRLQQRLARQVVQETARERRAHAAVAIVLRESHGSPEILLIERAHRENDPWSGHIAFPGGRIDRADPTPRATAERETAEEISLPLNCAVYLGQLSDLDSALHSIIVSGFVYRIQTPRPLKRNEEVRRTFWVPLNHLRDPRRQTCYRLKTPHGETSYPAIDLFGPCRPVLWGLTLRFAQQLFSG